jgi:hypothetical protein
MRPLIRLALLPLAVALALAAAPVRAQDTPAPTLPATPPPVVRTTVSPPEGAVVGQHIALYVDVLFPGDMPHPPRVTIPDLPGAQVMRFETQGTTLRDTINGTGYVGQRFEFAVFPRRGGTLAIPPAAVTLLDRAGDVIGTANGQPLEETITIPDGIDADAVVVATEKLTLDQSWKPDPKGAFHAGDALERTITRTAADIPALAMRDLAFDAPDGVRVYVDDPVNQDESNRGTITGKRIDRATYVFEKVGTFELPEVTQPWWNLVDKQAETASGAKTTATVKRGPAPAANATGQATTSSQFRPAVWVLIAGGAILVAGILLVALARRHRDSATHPGKTAERAEREAFDAFRRTCDTDNPVATYGALAAWRAAWQALPTGSAEPPLYSALDAVLFSNAPATNPNWSRQNAKVLFSTQRAFRHTLLKGQELARLPALPPLNPA